MRLRATHIHLFECVFSPSDNAGFYNIDLDRYKHSCEIRRKTLFKEVQNCNNRRIVASFILTIGVMYPPQRADEHHADDEAHNRHEHHKRCAEAVVHNDGVVENATVAIVVSIVLIYVTVALRVQLLEFGTRGAHVFKEKKTSFGKAKAIVKYRHCRRRASALLASLVRMLCSRSAAPAGSSTLT